MGNKEKSCEARRTNSATSFALPFNESLCTLEEDASFFELEGFAEDDILRSQIGADASRWFGVVCWCWKVEVQDAAGLFTLRLLGGQMSRGGGWWGGGVSDRCRIGGQLDYSVPIDLLGPLEYIGTRVCPQPSTMSVITNLARMTDMQQATIHKACGLCCELIRVCHGLPTLKVCQYDEALYFKSTRTYVHQ